jgi:hypothetical protein
MSHKRNKIIRSLAPAIVVAAAVASSASAATVDLRSPDARDAARMAQQTPGVDLRSPDARDAARAAQQTQGVDLRSPDARDAGRVESSLSPSPAQASEPTGTDWGDVSAVAGGVLGLVMIGLGGLVLVTRRRGATRKPGTSVASG